MTARRDITISIAGLLYRLNDDGKAERAPAFAKPSVWFPAEDNDETFVVTETLEALELDVALREKTNTTETISDEIFGRVQTVLEWAEGMYGPTEDDYLDLMQRVACDAMQRRRTYTGILNERLSETEILVSQAAALAADVGAIYQDGRDGDEYFAAMKAAADEFAKPVHENEVNGGCDADSVLREYLAANPERTLVLRPASGAWHAAIVCDGEGLIVLSGATPSDALSTLVLELLK